MKLEEIIIVSSPKSGRCLNLYHVDAYNNLPNVNEIFEDYDVANVADIKHDAKLSGDYEFYNDVKLFMREQMITKQIDGNYVVLSYSNNRAIITNSMDNAIFIYGAINELEELK